MELGAFSVSLSVSDLKASREFYEKLGFQVFGGAMEKNYLILKSGDTLIGLFQGMFEKNILTFNPGWDQDAGKLEEFPDVRELHDKVLKAGIPVVQATLPETSGPGSFVLEDPDGNPILIDQHV
jgi:catechol 2,3-dioxygenase-like lactoylglutathione lyase family enzyme